MTQTIKFSVFTPVYNRKNTIHRVWNSLKNQTYKNFEWIVVDDGSTDGVWDMLLEWKKEANFPMILIRQEKNMGKHIAWNRALEVATGELFVPADSDDSFVPTALERFAFHWTNTIPSKERYKFSGINVLCKDPNTEKIIGDKYPKDIFVSNNLDLHFKYKIRGEKWGCIRTDVLRERPFKEVRGSFLPENWIWFYIARKYKVLCVNEALRYYYTDDKNRLSKPSVKNLLKSAESYYTYLTRHLNDNFDYILKYENVVNIFKQFVRLWRFAFLSDKSIKEVINSFDHFILKVLSFFSLPFASLIYFFTFYKAKNK